MSANRWQQDTGESVTRSRSRFLRLRPIATGASGTGRSHTAPSCHGRKGHRAGLRARRAPGHRGSIRSRGAAGLSGLALAISGAGYLESRRLLQLQGRVHAVQDQHPCGRAVYLRAASLRRMAESFWTPVSVTLGLTAHCWWRTMFVIIIWRVTARRLILTFAHHCLDQPLDQQSIALPTVHVTFQERSCHSAIAP